MAGSYSICATLTDANGCSATYCQNDAVSRLANNNSVLSSMVYINVVSSITTATASPTTICAGGTSTLTASGSTTYSWSPAIGLSATTGSMVAASRTVTTTYTVVGTTGASTVSTAVTVSVNPLPTNTGSITGTSPVCANSNIVCGIPPAIAGLTYNWSVSAGAVILSGQGTTSVTVNVPTSGIYTLSVTSSNACGTSAPATLPIIVNPLPTIHFAASHPCLGTAATITNTSPNQASITTWSWNFGDGSTNGTASPPAHTYSAAGCYSVALTATNTSGCIGSFDTTVYVHANPTATFNALEACLGTSSDFIDGSYITNPSCLNDHITSWQWVFGDGLAATYTAGALPDTVKHTYASCGAYNITLTVTTNNGCSSTVTLTGDTLFCLPVVSAPSSFSICPGEATPIQTFTATCANGGVPTTVWLQSLGGTDNTGAPTSFVSTGGNNQVPSYNAITSNMSCHILQDTVYGIAVSGVGCLGNVVYYTANVYPTPYIEHMENDSACANQNISVPNFTVCPINSVITWTNSNAGIGLATTGAGNMGSFTGTNTTDVLNTAQINVVPSANGCMGNDSSFIIVVNPIPVMTAIGATVCPGDNVPSPSITTNPATGVMYNWTVTNASNIGMPASGMGTPVAYTAPSNNTLTNQIGIITYHPKLNGCFGVTATDTINLKPTPFMQPIANQYVCPNSMTNPVTFGTLPPSVNSTYNWIYNAGGIPTNGNTNPFPSLGPTVNNGSSTISMVVTVSPTLNGCQGPDSTFTIYVYPNPCSAGIEQYSNKDLDVNIYPNPNNGSFVIESSSATKQTMQVYDVNGKVVLSQTITGKTTIDARNLNEGFYNISLQSNEGVVNKWLVIVK